tara:strand:- start:7826 stop:8650 length:825 start_codon:yes stop_codon:yes gene_type:complete
MNNTELLAFVSINGMDVPAGGNKRMVCPACNAEHENSFMIRKNDMSELTGYCFRVSCPISGKVIGNKSVYSYEKRNAVSSFKPRVYEGEKVAASRSLALWMFKKYNIPMSVSRREGLCYDTKYQRQVWPVYDKEGKQFGHMTKQMPDCKDSYPKWVTYFERETNKLHYPRANVWNMRYDSVVLVEDIISAIRIAQFRPAVALLGTHMTQGMVNELRQGYAHATVALDPDATTKAFKMARKFSGFFEKGMDFRPLLADPKDIETDEQLQQQLGKM